MAIEYYRSIGNWAQFLIVSHNHRAFNNIYASWLKYNHKSLELHLLATLVYVPLKTKLALFVKLKRECLRLSTKKYLDEIILQHQDIIGIVHNVYHNQQDRRQISEGIKQLFISFKVTEAKIYSVVFIEFALSLYNEQYEKHNE